MGPKAARPGGRARARAWQTEPRQNVSPFPRGAGVTRGWGPWGRGPGCGPGPGPGLEPRAEDPRIPQNCYLLRGQSLDFRRVLQVLLTPTRALLLWVRVLPPLILCLARMTLQSRLFHEFRTFSDVAGSVLETYPSCYLQARFINLQIQALRCYRFRKTRKAYHKRIKKNLHTTAAGRGPGLEAERPWTGRSASAIVRRWRRSRTGLTDFGD